MKTRFAAIVFAISGLTYFGWIINSTVSDGLTLNSATHAIFAVLMLNLSYGLLKLKDGARKGGIAGGLGIAVFLTLISWPSDWAQDPQLRTYMGVAAFFFVAHVAVVGVLVRSRQQRPNRSLNKDALTRAR